MSHNILIKHGWELVFVGKFFVSYQLEDKMLVVWDNGAHKVYEVQF